MTNFSWRKDVPYFKLYDEKEANTVQTTLNKFFIKK